MSGLLSKLSLFSRLSYSLIPCYEIHNVEPNSKLSEMQYRFEIWEPSTCKVLRIRITKPLGFRQAQMIYLVVCYALG